MLAGRRGRWAAGAALAAVVAAGCSDVPERAQPFGGSPEPGPTTVVGGGGSKADQVAAAVGRRPLPVSLLRSVGSCAEVEAAVRPAFAEAVGPYGFQGGGRGWGGREVFAGDVVVGASGGGSARRTSSEEQLAAAPALPQTDGGSGAASFSTTNVQEAGIDEPDVVKTDGKLLVSTVDGTLRVLSVQGEGAPKALGRLELPGGAGPLLLVGSKALVVQGAGGQGGNPEGPVSIMPVPGPDGRPVPPPRPTTEVAVVDLADPAAPKVERTHRFDGGYVDARLVGGVARFVYRSSPSVPMPVPSAEGFRSQEDLDRATAKAREAVRSAPASQLLPAGTGCDDAFVPAQPSGAGSVSVVSVDPRRAEPGEPVTVVAEAGVVYASASRLLVATTRWDARTGEPQQPSEVRSAVHAFDISDPAKARYAGSGDVPGVVTDQFGLSERAGSIRVASWRQSPTGSTESRLTVLQQGTGGELVEVGAVDGLGKGERLYGIRYVGDMAYLVTFRQVDPLYVLDLRDPKAPKLQGELKITGYSAYLHPGGDGRLLGLGQEATEQGSRVGTQLSLFDVADPTKPAKLAGAVIPGGSSEAEHDHHAFLHWPATGLVVVPVTTYDQASGRQATGVQAFKVGERTVAQAGSTSHPGKVRIARSLVVGDRLLTVSDVGVGANDLDDLADRGFTTFR